MKTRPTSVTIIAWILIVIGAISSISTLYMINNPLVLEMMQKSPIPVPVQYALNFVGLAISIVSGIAMLKGLNWARILYVGWSLFGFAIGFATSPMKMILIPGLVLVGVIAFFLYRPKANEFFLENKSADNAQAV